MDKNLANINTTSFVCINCGFTTTTLYNKYKGGIIKIPLCERCGKCVDKYVEYDLVIISLDVLLLKSQAFRHILVNSNIKSHWKFGLVLLLCETFTRLLRQRPAEDRIDTMPDYVIYSAFEVNLYWNFIVALLEMSTFLLGLMLWVWLWKYVIQKDSTWPSVYNLSCGVMLSNFGKILVLPAMLWGGRYSEIYVWLCHIFTVGANIQATRGSTGGTLTEASPIESAWKDSTSLEDTMPTREVTTATATATTSASVPKVVKSRELVLCPSMHLVSLTAAVVFGHILAYGSSNIILPMNFSIT